MYAKAGDTKEVMKTNRQPNLLFIMSDQQKATSLGLNQPVGIATLEYADGNKTLYVADPGNERMVKLTLK